MITNSYRYAVDGDFDMLDYSPTAWYDINDITTIYDSDTGGSQITDGTAVGRVEDKSGNANHATQATSGDRVTYQDSLTVSNNNPCLEWTTSTGYKGLDTPAMTSIDEVWAVIAYKDGVDSAFDTFQHILGGATGADQRVMGRSGLATLISGAASTDDVYINDGSITSTVLPLPLSIIRMPLIGTTNQAWQIGFGDENANRSWLGVMCEIVFFDYDLTSGDATEIFEGLASKWGITL